MRTAGSQPLAGAPHSSRQHKAASTATHTHCALTVSISIQGELPALVTFTRRPRTPVWAACVLFENVATTASHS